MTREQAISLLRDKPIRFAKMLGFDKLGELHNRWIIEMVRGKQDHTLQASRGTYKTTCVSFALAIIMILGNWTTDNPAEIVFVMTQRIPQFFVFMVLTFVVIFIPSFSCSTTITSPKSTTPSI